VKSNFPGAFSSEVDPGSRKENVPNKNPKRKRPPEWRPFLFYYWSTALDVVAAIIVIAVIVGIQIHVVAIVARGVVEKAVARIVIGPVVG
jgi:hypothetical protein